MTPIIEIQETLGGMFVIARGFRTVQELPNPEYRGSFAVKRIVFEFWGHRSLWVRQTVAARVFESFEAATDFAAQNQLELELT